MCDTYTMEQGRARLAAAERRVANAEIAFINAKNELKAAREDHIQARDAWIEEPRR